MQAKHWLLRTLVFMSISLNAQTSKEAIEKVLEDFIVGTEYNYPDRIEAAFYPEAQMFLFNTADTLLRFSPDQYASLYKRRPPGQRNKRYSKVLALDILLDVAYAKLQVSIPTFGFRFYDLLLLKRIEGKWLIVAKVTSAEPIPKTAQEHKPSPEKQIVMSGLKKPWSMDFINENEVLLAEKEGTLLRMNLQTKSRTIIGGLPTDVGKAIQIDTTKFQKGVYPASAHGQTHAFNAGWFQVLLDPNFQENQYVYLSYASMDDTEAAALKVIRARLIENRLEEMKTLLFAGPYTHGLFHFGGGMVFGKDDKLYIATGERNFYEHLNPIPPLAQDVSDMRGKIFRINPDGSIPNDNPDFGNGAVRGLYATGIRATQGMILDDSTGKIWFSDHGTLQGDELNLLQPGANYGWPHKTSGRYRSRDYNPPIPAGANFTAPIHYWDQTIAPTGLAVYRGNYWPQWEGSIIMPGLSKGSLWRLEMEGDSVKSVEELFVSERVRLRKAVVSPGGKLYLLTDEDDGKIVLVGGNKDQD